MSHEMPQNREHLSNKDLYEMGPSQAAEYWAIKLKDADPERGIEVSVIRAKLREVFYNELSDSEIDKYVEDAYLKCR